MKTVYLKESEFKKIKPTKTFPNENIIEGKINGVIYRIEKAGIITIESAPVKSYQHFGLTDKHSILRSSTGFFPTDIIAGVSKFGKYKDDYAIGLIIHGNMGSMSVGVIDTKKATELLKKNNWIVK